MTGVKMYESIRPSELPLQYDMGILRCFAIYDVFLKFVEKFPMPNFCKVLQYSNILQ